MSGPRLATVDGRPAEQPGLRAWLEYVAEAAIDLLDAMDRDAEDLEDDETEAGAAR